MLNHNDIESYKKSTRRIITAKNLADYVSQIEHAFTVTEKSIKNKKTKNEFIILNRMFLRLRQSLEQDYYSQEQVVDQRVDYAINRLIDQYNKVYSENEKLKATVEQLTSKGVYGI